MSGLRALWVEIEWLPWSFRWWREKSRTRGFTC